MVSIPHYNGTVNAPAGANSHYGSIKDTTGANDGTYFDRKAMNDIFIFESRLMLDAALTPSNTNDTESVSQLMTAFYTILTNLLNATVSVGSWIAMTTASPKWTTSSPCQGRVIQISNSTLTAIYVEFMGCFVFVFTTGSYLMCTLPSALRPLNTQYFQVPFTNGVGGVSIAATIEINTTGNIAILNSSSLLVSGNNGYFVDLSGVRIVIS